MAVLTDIPGTATVALSTLGVGTWCTIPTFPATAFRVMEQRAGDVLLSKYSATDDGTTLVRNLTTQVVAIPAPVSMTLDW